ncbi:MAG: hypothetical protein H6726_29050 [Sandaracinaceae bacterium]|nr:hypothetical protein [Sandaracinaceae bacterium]
MLLAVHAAQILFALLCARLVVRKLRQLAVADYQTQMVDAADDALQGGGDVGAFVDTAALDARHHAVAGVRVIRGMASVAGAVGLLAAMLHYFVLLHGDAGRSAASLAVAEDDANQGALVSMAIGLSTALSLFAVSRVIRRKVLIRLDEIASFGDQLEAAARRPEQWTTGTEE